MAETKAAILSLLIDAYQKRERVGLIVFRGREARVALPFTHSVEMAQRYLTHLPTGGKTPLPHALFLARELLRQEKARHPRDAFLLVLITDGRANLSLRQGRRPMEEVKELAGAARVHGDQRPGAGHGALRPLPGPGLPAGAEPAPGGPVPFGAEPAGPGGGGPHHRRPGRCRGPIKEAHRRRQSISPSRTIDNYRRLSYRINTPRPPVGWYAAYKSLY